VHKGPGACKCTSQSLQRVDQRRFRYPLIHYSGQMSLDDGRHSTAYEASIYTRLSYSTKDSSTAKSIMYGPRHIFLTSSRRNNTIKPSDIMKEKQGSLVYLGSLDLDRLEIDNSSLDVDFLQLSPCLAIFGCRSRMAGSQFTKHRMWMRCILVKRDATPTHRYNTCPAMLYQTPRSHVFPKPTSLNQNYSTVPGAHLFKMSAAPFFVSASIISALPTGLYDSGTNQYITQYKQFEQVVSIKVNTLSLQTPTFASQDPNIKSSIY
jgi:hypothetical protein